jgi:hypothetical protein
VDVVRATAEGDVVHGGRSADGIRLQMVKLEITAFRTSHALRGHERAAPAARRQTTARTSAGTARVEPVPERPEL